MIHVETFISDLDAEYREARETATRALDRARALGEIRHRAFAKYDALGRPPRPDEVMQSDDERENAELQRLVERATQEV